MGLTTREYMYSRSLQLIRVVFSPDENLLEAAQDLHEVLLLHSPPHESRLPHVLVVGRPSASRKIVLVHICNSLEDIVLVWYWYICIHFDVGQ